MANTKTCASSSTHSQGAHGNPANYPRIADWGQEEGTISDQVKVLEKAREEMVKARRSIAESLAKPYDGRTTPSMRATFAEIQTVIEQIDRAIADDRNIAPPPAPKGFPKDDRYKPYNE